MRTFVVIVGLLLVRDAFAQQWTTPGRTPEQVARARESACKGAADPILGCPNPRSMPAPPAETSEPVFEPFIIRREPIGFGVNGRLDALLPIWGPGVNLAVSAGLSLRMGSWFYEGWHRVTAAQIDLDASRPIFGADGGALFDRRNWLTTLAVGPVYQGWDVIAPSFKAQVFVTRPMAWPDAVRKGRWIDAVGISVAVGFDVTISRPAYVKIDPVTHERSVVQERPPLDEHARAYLFQDDQDDKDAVQDRAAEKARAEKARKQGTP